jgi:hypothetical protein
MNYVRIQVHRRRRAEHAAAASRATHYAAHFRGYHLIIVWCLRCEFRSIEYYIYFYLLHRGVVPIGTRCYYYYYYYQFRVWIYDHILNRNG